MKLHKQIETLFHIGTTAGLSDGQLLGRFVATRGIDTEMEAAFAALVDRHGAMVLRVCRHVLGNAHDAEDAAQATFLVLARRAGSIGSRESIASWLHRVALRVAAKARRADDRRRARERRASEMTASPNESNREGDDELYHELHDELSQLPESFRSPLVLCYFEGLTQEQAAARLCCPLGTVQSRLARGRAKLKARLEKRGIQAAPAFLGSVFEGQRLSAIPEPWVKSTVRLALQFVQRSASPADVAVRHADVVLHGMAITKLKLVGGVVVCALLLVSGVRSWSTSMAPHPPDPRLTVASNDLSPPPSPAPQLSITPPLEELERKVTRTVHGTVRDEQGRPVPHAWIGSGVEPMEDLWQFIASPDDIRQAERPYRDERGVIVHVGTLGNYFERRDERGEWNPVDPRDIRRYHPEQQFIALSQRQRANFEKMYKHGPLEARAAKGRQQMLPMSSFNNIAARTDGKGTFALNVDFSLPRIPATQLHVATPDFSRQAIVVVRGDTPDRPLDVTLQPVRRVQARVVETPQDRPDAFLDWSVYSTDQGDGNAYQIDAIGGRGALWAWKPRVILDRPVAPGELPRRLRNRVEMQGGFWATGPVQKTTRQLEVELPAGRYEVRFQSSTLNRTVEVVVPAGEGTLTLPEIRLESIAWAKMLGKPTAEIDAIDLEGKSVRLADFRGRVVVLVLWNIREISCIDLVDRIPALCRRFKGQPLAILTLHDASAGTIDDYKATAALLFREMPGMKDVLIRQLLDRKPAADHRAGRTFEAYEVRPSTGHPATFVIDKCGNLTFALLEEGLEVGFEETAFYFSNDGVLKEQYSGDLSPAPADARQAPTFAIDLVATALEEQLGLPQTARPENKGVVPMIRPATEREVPDGPLEITGFVVGPDLEPVAAAKISLPVSGAHEKEILTGPTGAFRFTLDAPQSYVVLNVAAPRLATGTFWGRFKNVVDFSAGKRRREVVIENSGRIKGSLRLGAGVEVTGRVVRRGEPLPRVTMILRHPATVRVDGTGLGFQRFLEDVEAESDEHGRFHFHAVPADEICSISVKPACLADDRTVLVRQCDTGKDGGIIKLGDLAVVPGHTLAGRVIFQGDKAPPEGTRLIVMPENAGDLSATVGNAGRFEIKGLPDGPIYVWVKLGTPVARASGDGPAFRLSRQNKCLDPVYPDRLQGMLRRDVTDLTILLEPGEFQAAVSSTFYGLDTAGVADFEDAKAGPIAGVPPRP